jgi:hypothetical protein
MGRAGISQTMQPTMLQSEIDLGPQVRGALDTVRQSHPLPSHSLSIKGRRADTMSDWSSGKVAANAAAFGRGFVLARNRGVGPQGRHGSALVDVGCHLPLHQWWVSSQRGKCKREAAKVLQGASPVSDYSLQRAWWTRYRKSIPVPAILKLLGIVK